MSEINETNKIQKATEKSYRCTKCNHESRQVTNHYGSTWSWGRVNTCPKCPPHAKYPEFGGRTVWKCMEQPIEVIPTTEKDELFDRYGYDLLIDGQRYHIANGHLDFEDAARETREWLERRGLTVPKELLL